MNKIFTLLTTLVLLMPQTLKPKNLCFDYGNVLGVSKKMEAGRKIGMTACIGYTMYRSSSMDPEQFFYHILNQIRPHGSYNPGAYSGTYLLPAIACDWLRSSKSNKEILDEILEGIKQRPEIFANNSEKKIVINLAKFMMNAKLFAPTMKIVPEMARLVKACYEQKDDRGERLHKLYVVTNFDKQAFDLILANPQYREFWSIFDGFYVSGELHTIKPEDDFYKIVKKDMIP